MVTKSTVGLHFKTNLKYWTIVLALIMWGPDASWSVLLECRCHGQGRRDAQIYLSIHQETGNYPAPTPLELSHGNWYRAKPPDNITTRNKPGNVWNAKYSWSHCGNILQDCGYLSNQKMEWQMILLTIGFSFKPKLSILHIKFPFICFLLDCGAVDCVALRWGLW